MKLFMEEVAIVINIQWPGKCLVQQVHKYFQTETCILYLLLYIDKSYTFPCTG